jgi:hypothetical protein
MDIKTIDNSIHWQEHVRDNTRDLAQRARCNLAIERLMKLRMELARAAREVEEHRGAREHAAWYDTSAELK